MFVLYMTVALGLLVEGIVCPPLLAVPLLMEAAAFSDAAIGTLAEVAGTVAAEAAPAFGYGASEIFFGNLVEISGVIYDAGNYAWSGMVGEAALIGAARAGVSGISKLEVTGTKLSSIKSSMSHSSKMSVQSMAASKVSVSSASRSSAKAELSKSEAQARASAQGQIKTGVPSYNTANNPYTFGTKSKRTDPAANGASPSIGTPPGVPRGTLPPGSYPTGIRNGVPEYNFRMCQYDIIKMNQTGKVFSFTIPHAQGLRIDNIPSTCMVLGNFLFDKPELGPHPIPMGAASLQYDNVSPDIIDRICKGWGIPPITPTSAAGAVATTSAPHKRHVHDTGI